MPPTTWSLPMPEPSSDRTRQSVGRPARATEFMPRTRPVVPPIHHSVTYFLDDRTYKDVQAGGLIDTGTAVSAIRPWTPPRARSPIWKAPRPGS
jgi:hypothetical protein